MRKEFLFSGSGGQGVITASIILAEAALYDGLVATQTQAYGPEARGGSARAEAIISDEPIHYNKVNHPNILLAMSQEAVDKYFKTWVFFTQFDLADMLFCDIGLFSQFVLCHVFLCSIKPYSSSYAYVINCHFSPFCVSL